MVGFKFAPAKIKAYLEVLLQTITNFLNLTRKEKQWLPFLALYQMDTETFFPTFCHALILPSQCLSLPMSLARQKLIPNQPSKFLVFELKLIINILVPGPISLFLGKKAGALLLH